MNKNINYIIYLFPISEFDHPLDDGHLAGAIVRFAFTHFVQRHISLARFAIICTKHYSHFTIVALKLFHTMNRIRYYNISLCSKK